MNPEDFIEDSEESTISYDPELLISVDNIDDFDKDNLIGSYGYFGNTENEIVIQFMENHKFSPLDYIDKTCNKAIFVNGTSYYKYFYYIDQDYVAQKKINKYNKMFGSILESFQSMSSGFPFSYDISKMTKPLASVLGERHSSISNIFRDSYLLDDLEDDEK